jgi:hypothetical protein
MGYTTENALKIHQEDCIQFKPSKAIMPTEGSRCKFSRVDSTSKHPMTEYHDLEAILEKANEKYGNGSKKIHKHKAIGVGMYNTLNKQYTRFIGEDCLDKYCIYLKDMVRRYAELTSHSKQIKAVPVLTKEEKIKHDECMNCWMCNKEFSKENYKVIDHDHLTGIYRGAAHSFCNLRNKVPEFIPIFYHNGSGYDIHHLIRYLVELRDDFGFLVKPSVIPISTEKFIAFSVQFLVSREQDSKGIMHEKFIELRFLDSFRFTLLSLDSLVKSSGDNFNIMRNILLNEGYTENDIKLLLRKGVFPYEWFDNVSKLNADRLPKKHKFYSSLSGDISEEDFVHANFVWNNFKIKKFQDYLELYLKTDVLLLADVFENFRDLCMKYYKLDPVYFYTCANFGFEAMFKYTNA